MKQHIDLHTLLSQTPNKYQQTLFFALLSLGIVESLVNGTISASNAVELFFDADNCLFVRRELARKEADEIMSRGVQLSDLFEVLPVMEAQQEFQRELVAMRLLCLKLLDNRQLAA